MFEPAHPPLPVSEPSRRGVLRWVLLSATGTGLGGCLSSLRGSTPPATGTEPTTPRDVVSIEVHNATSAGIAVRLTVRRVGPVVFEDEMEVPADARVSVGPGITETGDYLLQVSAADGPEGSREFSVEAYDLRMGSDLIVTVRADDVFVLMEE